MVVGDKVRGECVRALEVSTSSPSPPRAGEALFIDGGGPGATMGSSWPHSAPGGQLSRSIMKLFRNL